MEFSIIELWGEVENTSPQLLSPWRFLVELFHTRPYVEVKEPPKMVVLLHNDAYTPIEFVIQVLINLFQKTQQQATTIALEAHTNQTSVVGIYTHEIAETRVSLAMGFSKSKKHPLKITSEPA